MSAVEARPARRKALRHKDLQLFWNCWILPLALTDMYCIIQEFKG